MSSNRVPDGNSTPQIGNVLGLGAGVAGYLGSPTSATSKATPVGADELPLADSAASFGLKKLTLTNFAAWLASLAQTLANKTLTTPIINNPLISCTYTAKTASYTFVSGDEGNLFSMNNAATQQFNIPTDATFNFAIGAEFNVFWITGAGQPTIGAVTPSTTTVISTGATSATPKLSVVNAGATIKKIAANSWIVFGNLA